MHRVRNILWLGVALVAVGSVLGCGDAAVHPVKGKVNFENQPMKGGGSISFVPLGNQKGKAPGGSISEDGTYELMTNKPGDGSMEGEFRVVITQVTEREPQKVADGEKAPAKRDLSLPVADRIPAIYGDAYKSPLRATVKKGSNEINFDLKRNPDPATAPRKRDPLADTFAWRNDFRLVPRSE